MINFKDFVRKIEARNLVFDFKYDAFQCSFYYRNPLTQQVIYQQFGADAKLIIAFKIYMLFFNLGVDISSEINNCITGEFSVYHDDLLAFFKDSRRYLKKDFPFADMGFQFSDYYVQFGVYLYAGFFELIEFAYHDLMTDDKYIHLKEYFSYNHFVETVRENYQELKEAIK